MSSQCELCTDAALALLKVGEPSRRRTSFDYDAALSRVERRTIDTLASLSELGKRAEDLAEELSRLPDDPARRQRVQELARVELGVVAASLLGLSCRLVRKEPVRAGILAELAIVAAEGIDLADTSLKSGLLGRAQALLGEVLRRTRRFKEAEEAFAHAATYLSATADEASLSLYCQLLSRLRRVQGPIGEPLARFDRAASLLAPSKESEDPSV